MAEGSDVDAPKGAAPRGGSPPRGFRAFPWAACLPWLTGALLVVPVLAVRYPPMTDLPLYEGALALLRHWRDPGFVPPNVYKLNLGRTTQLSFALGYPLALVMPTATACKVLVSASIIAIVVGTARLARYVGAGPASAAVAAFLAAPVALGWIIFIGFVGYLVGTAIGVLVLPVFDRWVEDPTVRRGAAACSAVVVLHFAHLASTAFAVIALFALTAARGLDRRTPARLAPAALAVLLAVVDMHADRAVATAGALSWDARGAIWPPARIKLTMACDYLFGAVGTLPQALLLALVAAVVLGMVAASRRAPTTEPSAERGGPRRRFGWVAAALLLVYLVSPWAVGAGAYFDARFLPPAWMVGVAALAPAARTLLPRLTAACIPLAWLAVVGPVFADADTEQRALAELFPRIAPSSAVAVLRLHDDDPAPYLRVSAGNRVLAERGGRVLFSLSEAPRAPVLIARHARWDEAVSRLYASGPEFICPPHDATRFRYLLVRIPDIELALRAARALSPEYRVTRTAGAWLLLESTRSTVPLDAPDAAPPSRCALLADRIAATLAHTATAR